MFNQNYTTKLILISLKNQVYRFKFPCYVFVGSSDKSGQSWPITTDWTIWPIRAE